MFLLRSQIIGELVTQSSRHLFLQLCLQVEAEQVLSNLELLMGTMDHINGEVEKYQQRMVGYLIVVSTLLETTAGWALSFVIQQQQQKK